MCLDGDHAVGGAADEAVFRIGPIDDLRTIHPDLDVRYVALDAGADMILLDNMSLADLRKSVELCRGRAITEASGGVTEDTIVSIAETGIDLISVGALTHSVKAVDFSLLVD